MKQTVYIKEPGKDTIIYPDHHIALRDPNLKCRVIQISSDGDKEPFAEAHVLQSQAECRPMLRMFAYTGEFRTFGGDAKAPIMAPLFTMLSQVRGYYDSSPAAVALEMADRFCVICNLNFQGCTLHNCTVESLQPFRQKISYMVDLFMIHLRREMGTWS